MEMRSNFLRYLGLNPGYFGRIEDIREEARDQHSKHLRKSFQKELDEVHKKHKEELASFRGPLQHLQRLAGIDTSAPNTIARALSDKLNFMLALSPKFIEDLALKHDIPLTPTLRTFMDQLLGGLYTDILPKGGVRMPTVAVCKAVYDSSNGTSTLCIKYPDDATYPESKGVVDQFGEFHSSLTAPFLIPRYIKVQHYWDLDTKPYILCAANKHTSGDIVLGVRHWDSFMSNAVDALPDKELKKGNWTQGFVDQFGEFYDRKEAYCIAEDCQQIVRLTGSERSRELYSENLY